VAAEEPLTAEAAEVGCDVALRSGSVFDSVRLSSPIPNSSSLRVEAMVDNWQEKATSVIAATRDEDLR
jgi:hypothetical protein